MATCPDRCMIAVLRILLTSRLKQKLRARINQC
jgi:hypothetical protein